VHFFKKEKCIFEVKVGDPDAPPPNKQEEKE
jgi:hypothetical protein